MAGDKELIERLEEWVGEHPEDADVPHIHLTTQKEFTIRGILEQLVEEEETGVAIVEDELLEIKGLIKDWMGG